MSNGFKNQSTQAIYAKYKIYAEDARSIAQALNLGHEPFKASEVESIVRFAQQAKDGNLTLKQAIAQWQQIQSQQSSERPNEPLMDPLEASQNSSLAAHLQSLVVKSADRAQQELEALDLTIYEQVELPAAQAAVQRVLD